MPLTYTVYRSVDEISGEQWDQLSGGDGDLTIDRRLIGAMELTMGQQYPFASIVVADERGRAAAIACTWEYRIDLQDYAWLRPFMKVLPRPWRERFKIGLLFCGLPMPFGQNHLRLSRDCDRAAVVATVNRALRELAREKKQA
jgi:hypothetical protein